MLGDVDSVNSIILRWDTDLRVTFINDFALEFFGLRRERHPGTEHYWHYSPRHKRQPAGTSGHDAQHRREPERYVNNENENVRHDGTRVWIYWTNRAVRDSEGKVIEILSVGNDVTRRRRAEEALKEQLKMTQTLLDAIPVPVFYKDANGVYTGCNQAFADFLGKPKDEIIGRTVYEVCAAGPG